MEGGSWQLTYFKVLSVHSPVANCDMKQYRIQKCSNEMQLEKNH
jgi:hypothetical protein